MGHNSNSHVAAHPDCLKRRLMDANIGKLDLERKIVVDILHLVDNPKRQLCMLVALLVCAEIVLVILHFVFTVQLAHITSETTDGHIAGFDLADEANLGVWFSSFQLMLLCRVCLFISWFEYDQVARLSNCWYWRFASFLFGFMSIDETSGLHEIFGHCLSRTFPSIEISAQMWWTIPYVVCIGFVVGFYCLRFFRQPILL